MEEFLGDLLECLSSYYFSDSPTSDGKDSPFGLGWGVSQREGREMVGFNGLQPSTTSSIHYFPREGVGIVLLCNAQITNAEADQRPGSF